MPDMAAADDGARIEALQQRVGPRYPIKNAARTMILLEGILFQHVPGMRSSVTSNVREAIVFADALLLLKQENKSQLSVTEVPLANCTFHCMAVVPPENKLLENGFQIAAGDVVHTFAATDAAAKAQWVSTLSDAILETYPFERRLERGFVHKVVRHTLWSAAVLGDAAMMRLCAEAAVATDPSSVDALDGDGFAALHYAALHNHVDVAAILIESGARIDVPDTSDFNSPLHIAACAGHLEFARFLVENLAPLDTTNFYGATPLVAVIKAADNADAAFRVVDWLLDRGADAAAVDGDDWQPIHHAVDKGFVPIVIALIRKGASPNLLMPAPPEAGGGSAALWSLLHCAAGAGSRVIHGEAAPRRLHLPLVCALLENGAAPNALCGPQRETVLHLLLRTLIAGKKVASAEQAAAIAEVIAAACRVCAYGGRLDVADKDGCIVAKLAEDAACKAALEAAVKDFASRLPPPAAPANVARLGRVAAPVFHLDEKATPLARLGHAAAPWKSDAAATACPTCAAPFTMFSRKHHCRHCGALVCSACSSKKYPLLPPVDAEGEKSRLMPQSSPPAAGEAAEPQRVCDSCFNRLCALHEALAAQDKIWAAEKAKAVATAKNFADERSELLGSAARPANKPPSTGAKMAAVTAQLSETKEKLAERGEKIAIMEDRSAEMADSAKNFADMAAQLRKQSKGTSWFGF